MMGKMIALTLGLATFVANPEPVQDQVFPRTHDIIFNYFTSQEEQEILKVAENEAGNQGEDGMWLVMSTIINRKNSDSYPDTITEVIHQPHQFAINTDSTMTNEMVHQAETALERIKFGDVAPKIIAFEILDSDVLDKYFTWVFEYRDHKFYVERSDGCEK